MTVTLARLHLPIAAVTSGTILPLISPTVNDWRECKQNQIKPTNQPTKQHQFFLTSSLLYQFSELSSWTQKKKNFSNMKMGSMEERSWNSPNPPFKGVLNNYQQFLMNVWPLCSVLLSLIPSSLQMDGFSLSSSRIIKVGAFNSPHSEALDWTELIFSLDSPKDFLQKGIHVTSKISFKGYCQNIWNNLKTHLLLLVACIPLKQEAEVYLHQYFISSTRHNMSRKMPFQHHMYWESTELSFEICHVSTISVLERKCIHGSKYIKLVGWWIQLVIWTSQCSTLLQAS